MPTYDYHCPSCGARFEVWQKITDDPLTTCQTCGAPIHRVLYPAGIVFKGSGFYSTDHRANGTNGSKASESDTGPAGEKPSDKPSDKPAEKPRETASSPVSKTAPTAAE